MKVLSSENLIEGRILNSPVFAEAIRHQSGGPGHTEKNLNEHIEQILAFIDRQPWAPSAVPESHAQNFVGPRYEHDADHDAP